MKRWHVLASGFGIVVLISAVSFTAITASGNTKFTELGKNIQAAGKQPQVVVARINGEEVSLQEIEARRGVMQLNKQLAGDNSAVSRKDALQALVRSKAEMAEARKRGLVPSDAEVDKQYKLEEAQWASAPQADRDRREAVIAAYLQGAGITRAQYEETARKLTGIQMAIERLRQDFKSKLPGNDAASKEAAYRSFANDLTNGAKVETAHPEYLENQ